MLIYKRILKQRHYQKILIIFVLGLILCGSDGRKGSRNIIEFEFRYPEEQLKITKMKGYDYPDMEGAFLAGEVGEPVYPVFSYKVALPPGAEIDKIEIVEQQKKLIPGKYKIYPQQPVTPLSYKAQKFVPLNPEILNRTTPYPNEIIQNIRTGDKGGFQIGLFWIAPLIYTPREGKLELIEYIKIRIHYKEGDAFGFHERIINNMARNVKRMVINPEVVSQYALILKSLPRRQAYSLPAGDYEYVIISKKEWQRAWQPLMDWKTKKGIRATFYSVEDILTQYTGRNTHDKVKRFIADAYNTWGTLWFLLGGDVNTISDAPCYGHCGIAEAKDIASTRFFEALYKGNQYQTWDHDNDNLYCEFNVDGPGGSTIDLLADCYVGRVPVNYISEIESFVHRILTYERTPTLNYQNKIMFWTAKFHDNDLPENRGKTGAEQLERRLRNAGINYLTYTKLYDEDGTYISDVNALNHMNTGYNWTIVYSHGCYTEVLYGEPHNQSVSSSDLDSLLKIQDKKWGIHTGMVCRSGGYHKTRHCYAKHWIIDRPGGVASIFNSDYGIGTGPSEPGDTSRGAYQLSLGLLFRLVFYTYVHNDWRIGEALANARDAHNRFVVNLPDPNTSGQKWALITYNLLGDPEMPVWRNNVRNLQVEHRNLIQQVGPQTIDITVRDATTGSPIRGATVCIMTKIDTIYRVDTTNASGIASFNFTLRESNDTLWITCTRYEANYKPYEGFAVIRDTGAPTIPIITRLVNHEKTPHKKPTFKFTSNDPQGNNLQYEIMLAKNPEFNSPTSELTNTYPSGTTVNYTLRTALEHGKTYWWKVRAKDPTTQGHYSEWSEVRCFTVDTTLINPAWFIGKGAQFKTCSLINAIIRGDSILVGYTAIDTLLKEGFESTTFPPPGWAQLRGPDDTANGEDWALWRRITTAAQSGAASAEIRRHGTKMVDRLLVTPKLRLKNYNRVKMTFWGSHQLLAYYKYHGIWGSTKSQTNVNDFSEIATGTYGPDITWFRYEIDLSQYDESDSAWFAFRYREKGGSNWRIDNIVIVGVKKSIGDTGKVIFPLITYHSFPNSIGWKKIEWTQASSQDSIKIQVEYLDGGNWRLIPNSDLPNNSTGYFTNTEFGEIDIQGINPTIYDTIRVVATLICKGTNRAANDPALKNLTVKLKYEVGEEESEKFKFAIYQNYPNPFSSKTTIQYSVAHTTNVSLKIYDISGREVKTLVNKSHKPGIYTANWDTKEQPAGVYFIKFKAGDYKETKKMVLIR